MQKTNTLKQRRDKEYKHIFSWIEQTHKQFKRQIKQPNFYYSFCELMVKDLYQQQNHHKQGGKIKNNIILTLDHQQQFNSIKKRKINNKSVTEKYTIYYNYEMDINILNGKVEQMNCQIAFLNQTQELLFVRDSYKGQYQSKNKANKLLPKLVFYKFLTNN